ncbi:hypothetical protein BO94DRAFT_535764 [Aspergillus sclerotioniger CBS 115572]|uniref:Uncharacterized protein n=1 Tax=Aspergillus sclerotioniger CBS 115572 TaxID=1450535 RepID=A0A317WJW5_9EURO|nr:hypothetical protein BO94DRAFT_535764 [Aspergillus sclerotioniger CBS 115572]PWY86619.1 hypothetical protein BO94DRAFT_535764 [Aspergillus sclerotioniger CBS 115572]
MAAQAVSDHRQHKAGATNRANPPAPYGGQDVRSYGECERHQQDQYPQASGTNARYYDEREGQQHYYQQYPQANGADARYYNGRAEHQPNQNHYQQAGGPDARYYDERAQHQQNYYEQAGGANASYYHGHEGQQPYQARPYQPQPYQQQEQYQQTSAGAGARGLSLKSLFSSKVLYLMVVNMPTEEEMAQAQRLTANWNLQGQQQRF